MFRRRAFTCLLAAPALACASTSDRKVDVAPARAAVERAREAGAAEKATETYSRAQGHLKDAETAAGQPRRSQQASCLVDLTVAEAECAARLASVQAQADRLPEAQKEAAEADRLAARLRRSEDEQRRLEERVAVLMRDLELTETEVIRTKARLQGLESKADSTSVIAETRVLVRRAQEQRGRTPAIVRSQELLDRSEQMVEEGNFGAATFLALKAQELLKDVRRGGGEEGGDRVAPRRQYTVTATTANLRREPARDAPVLATLKRGAVLDAVAQRGEWLQVKAGDKTGWIFRTLVD